MKLKIFRCQSIFIILMTTIILLNAGSLIKCESQIEVSVNKTSLAKNINSNLSNKNLEFNPWIALKFFGSKTFICILYLFFQVNGFLLFFTSVGLQIILTYIIGFLNINFFQYVPIQLVETVAVIFYYGFSFGIIYSVVFGNSNTRNNSTLKKKPREFYDYYQANHFSYYISIFAEFQSNFLDEFIKIFGLIFISYLIQSDEFGSEIINSGNNLAKVNSFINFGTECLVIIVSSLLAIIIASLMNYKFHVNCNLWLGSIILMLMGTEICVKMLSRT
jgi:hypothetical protein